MSPDSRTPGWSTPRSGTGTGAGRAESLAMTRDAITSTEALTAGHHIPVSPRDQLAFIRAERGAPRTELDPYLQSRGGWAAWWGHDLAWGGRTKRGGATPKDAAERGRVPSARLSRPPLMGFCFKGGGVCIGKPLCAGLDPARLGDWRRLTRYAVTARLTLRPAV